MGKGVKKKDRNDRHQKTEVVKIRKEAQTTDTLTMMGQDIGDKK